MYSVPVTLRSRAPDVPPHVVEGKTPTLISPLCVTPFVLWDMNAKAWGKPDPDDMGFQITHRPTGFSLGTGLGTPAEQQGVVFDTEAEALAVMARCEPDFPAWPLAGDNEAARAACRTKFKWAMERP